MKNQKNIVLFVNAVRKLTFKALDDYKNQTGIELKPVVVVDEKIKDLIAERNAQKQHLDRLEIISADFDSAHSMRKALEGIADSIYAVTSQYENSVYELKKLLPYLPYLPTPSESTLDWATEKKLMRQILEAYDSSLVPKYMEVEDSSDQTISAIEACMSYPMIVKPSGLEGSLLVTKVNDHVELKKVLEFTFKEIQKGYDTWIKRQRPAVLVEEFMSGSMYSIDSYISKNGTFYHTPLIKVITGSQVGFDDFFGYKQSAPADLSEIEIKNAQRAAEEACKALGLRSVTAHTELMKTLNGWKIIELGPRVGGFRHEIYSNAYGINHIMNDILNRAGDKPIIPNKLIRYTAYIKIYAKQEGILKSVEGSEKVELLKSFVQIKQNIHQGEAVAFAKNNGDAVFEILLSHEDEEQLNSDIKLIESDLVLLTT